MTNYYYLPGTDSTFMMLLVPDGMGGWQFADASACCCATKPLICESWAWKPITSISAMPAGFSCNPAGPWAVSGGGVCVLNLYPAPPPRCDNQAWIDWCTAANATFSATPPNSFGTGISLGNISGSIQPAGCISVSVNGIFCLNYNHASGVDSTVTVAAQPGSVDGGATWQWYGIVFYATSGGLMPSTCSYYFGPSGSVTPVGGVLDMSGTFSLPFNTLIGACIPYSCLQDGSPLSLTFTT